MTAALVTAWQTGDGFGFVCGCGMTTLVQLAFAAPDGTPLAPENVGAVVPQETAVTCDGCGNAHWITIAPKVM